MTNPTTIESFIQRWRASGAGERANFQQFAVELCDLLGVDRPDPTRPDEVDNAYVFEKSVPLPHGSTGRIDLYRRGHFVMEAKQGVDAVDGIDFAALIGRRRRRGTAVRGTASWDTEMEKARRQAEAYARNLPPAELGKGGRPPFLVVVDVGNTLALYSEFTRTGGNYVPFPDPVNYRFDLEDLHDADVRTLLAALWADPMSLDPTRRSARVTRRIAEQLAQLARSLEGKHDAEAVAGFLMRCLFTMFAEDVGLLPDRSFTHLLADLRNDPASFAPMLEHLWQTMNRGGFSVILRTQIPQFNGGLFADVTALPLDGTQLDLLMAAAQADWRDVEPAIFGTLLERALDPVERHKLGAHYTPRAYVDRLVQPTLMDPLRREWDAVKAAALLLSDEDRAKDALSEIDGFQRRLSQVRVLDPACGSGNFLYVALEHLKRLEGEVLEVRRNLGGAGSQLTLEMAEVMVTPQQFHGIEVNPRAAAIAELVLWIGYLQWHFRTRGETTPSTPILRNFHNIECRDAVLAWRAQEPLLDADGAPITRWDGRTTRPHPVTGEDVPDERARVPVYRYLDPQPAQWPAADFIVGNPPFIGTARMRDALGDGYTEALRRTYSAVPDSADYVMYWWHNAAQLLRQGQIERFGFITTNSLRQTFNRRVLQTFLGDQTDVAASPLSLVYAIPDHPWVDSQDGAAVRIAMTVAAREDQPGLLRRVVHEQPGDGDAAEIEFDDKVGKIQADLTIGADVAGTLALQASRDLSAMGVKLHGSGFIVTQGQAANLGLGVEGNVEQVIRPYRNGRDLTAKSRNVMVIDFYGHTVEEVQQLFPQIYQWIADRVKPERDQNRDKRIREEWWLHGRTRPELREALRGLSRYIATVETSKHRFFVFLDGEILPDNMLVNIALDDAFFLGVLSSRFHVVWALAAGGTLEDRPRYNKTRCFEPFPFPDPTDEQKQRIRELGERLDGHRKRQQAAHPELTLTDLYNVLEKERSGEALTAKERRVHEQGLVAVLRQIHHDLDAAVAAAYGWPADLPDEAILERLVTLNAARAAEEAAGLVRWLRPEYQAPDQVLAPTQSALIDVPEDAAPAAVADAVPATWPDALPEQARAVAAILAAASVPVTADDIAARFGRRSASRRARVQDLLETLVLLGQARPVDGERYVGG